MTVAASVAADPWLTERLGIPAAHLNGCVPGHLPSGPSFVDAKVPAGDVASVHALEDAGFRVVDTAVTLERGGRDLGVIDGLDGLVGFAEPADADAVGAIAATALVQSRFHLDPQIPDAVACSLKAAWARAFFTGDRGDWMVVARRDGQVAGFLLLIDRPEALVIDLVAVGVDHQGNGLGRAMIGFAAARCGSAPVIRVGTQAANIGSLRFYESLGFRVVGTEHVLHRHGA